MELGLSLGDAKSTRSGGSSANVVDKSLGFCMALNGTSHQQMDKTHSQDDDHEYDDGDGDGEEQEKDDQLILKRNGGISEIIIGSNQRISSLNPPVQLDLLPSAPVPRHTSVPRSTDNGSSEGGSSGNVVSGRGFDMRKIRTTEEATSSFRLEFKNKNHKRGLEIGNDVVDVEKVSDEEDNGMSRKKLRLSKEQSAYLEQTFKEHNTLNPKQKIALAEQLNLRPRQVEVWFQNRRARTKLKQTEMDYEYLKRCCETLTEENRRLHKELQEIRALKTTSNPFYKQLPATTLTMCPSCERVDTTSIKNGSTPVTNPPKPKSLNSPMSYVPQSSNSLE